MSPNLFNALGPRQVMPYYRGNLALDCHFGGPESGPALVRKAAWRAYKEGRVVLVQERDKENPCQFVYKAIGKVQH